MGHDDDIQTLLLTGTIGTGKTAVATEVGRILEERRLPNAVIDLDWLNWVWVGDGFDGYDALLATNLAAIWPNFRAAGVRYLVLARALQDLELLRLLREALPRLRLTVVQLTAPPEVVAERLRRRDAGETLAGHLQETVTMTASMEAAGVPAAADAVVRNDGRPVHAVAREVLDRVGWR